MCILARFPCHCNIGPYALLLGPAPGVVILRELSLESSRRPLPHLSRIDPGPGHDTASRRRDDGCNKKLQGVCRTEVRRPDIDSSSIQNRRHSYSVGNVSTMPDMPPGLIRPCSAMSLIRPCSAMPIVFRRLSPSRVTFWRHLTHKCVWYKTAAI